MQGAPSQPTAPPHSLSAGATLHQASGALASLLEPQVPRQSLHAQAPSCFSCWAVKTHCIKCISNSTTGG